MSQNKRIAIIGAGPSGLSAIKCCKEEGFLPVCYERNGVPGGLWRYHDEDIEGVASVMKTTIINTSKEYGAFSDFPPPKDFPNYMHNTKMFQYFMMYAEHFNLLKHIRYHLEAVKVEPAKNFDATGKWSVTVRSTQTEALSKEDFDAVMVCIGHHVYPNIPTFPGQETFKGTITHTHSVKNCQKFEGQRVVVVGIGNSGVDAAVDSTYAAEQVYLSTRKGSWIISRLGPNGRPSDIDFTTRWHDFLRSFISYNSICDELEKNLNKKFDHAVYNLKPKHRVLSAHPTMNDNLPNCILAGRVVIKGDIERFEENGVVFAGDDKVTPIDAVILATGYHIKFPFLDSSVVTTKDNKIHLYKNVLPVNLKHQTIALIGLIQPLGPIFPCAEMQCRWFMQIISKNLKLPSVVAMKKDIQYRNEVVAKRYVPSLRHTIQVDFRPYMDELAQMFGVKPNMWKLAVTDPKLFWMCLFGPILPYQFRIHGPHAWRGAREALLRNEERILAPLNTKKPLKNSKEHTHYLTAKKVIFILTACGMSALYAKGYLDKVPGIPKFA